MAKPCWQVPSTPCSKAPSVPQRWKGTSRNERGSTPVRGPLRKKQQNNWLGNQNPSLQTPQGPWNLGTRLGGGFRDHLRQPGNSECRCTSPSVGNRGKRGMQIPASEAKTAEKATDEKEREEPSLGEGHEVHFPRYVKMFRDNWENRVVEG
ncbi:hypothetical protein SKAU_G00012000 [Synaphobranchus kaupii]|uniref:Uncharacterized protein n=1 Tax=Synaphobranchus kaupii TaxID=118154 RepID=A0A9Q1GAE9_SYNKA|nr:hypothetical protein SKAU_G00012000 [Synaphobranchus kaupii]